MILIFDFTTLIYFAKIKILNKLKKLKVARIIPELVYKEVVLEGKQRGKEDALIIEKLVTKKIFNIEKSKNKKFVNYLSQIPSLDLADAETLALAKELQGIAILDETSSRNIAEIENIKYHGSVFLLFFLYHNKLINKDEIKPYIDKMINSGWRCSTEFYAAVLEEIERL